MKPQLAVLFPLALRAGQARALAAWAATIACSVALSTRVRVRPWLTFAHVIDHVYAIVGAGNCVRMPSVRSQRWQAGPPSSRTASSCCRPRPRPSPSSMHGAAPARALRAATLACACLLVSPYLYDTT